MATAKIACPIATVVRALQFPLVIWLAFFYVLSVLYFHVGLRLCVVCYFLSFLCHLYPGPFVVFSLPFTEGLHAVTAASSWLILLLGQSDL